MSGSKTVDEQSVLRDQYDRASVAWPRIEWPFSAFRLHHDTVVSGSSDHLTDLFLSGAAAFNMDNAWDAVVETTRDPSLRFLNARFGLSDEVRSDIYTTILRREMERDPAFPTEAFEELGFGETPRKIVNYHGAAKLVTYILTGVRHEAYSLFRSKRRGLSTAMRGGIGIVEDANSDEGAGDAASDAEYRMMMGEIQRALDELADRLSSDDKLVYLLVADRGFNLTEAAEFMGWGHASRAMRRFRAVSDSIQEAIQAVTGEHPSVAGARVLEELKQIVSRAVQSSIDGASNTLGDPRVRPHHQRTVDV